MYVNYDYYSNNYGGKVSSTDFTTLEIKAKKVLDYYTFNRIETVDDNVKLAVCELIDFIQEDEEGKEIESEKVGSYSVTYAKQSVFARNRKQKAIINKYLGHTNLLYRGG